MKKILTVFLAIVLCALFICMTGCKAEDEIAAIVTPNPDSQTVVIRQDGLEKYVEVSGHGVYEVAPELAVITLDLSGSGRSMQEAYQGLDEKKVVLIDALKAEEISEEDISSEGIVLEAVVKDDGKMSGTYKAYETLNINLTNLEKAVEISDAVFELGISDVHSLTYTLTDTEEAYRKALDLAMEDAKKNAKSLASGSSIVIGKPMQIIETSDSKENDSFRTFESDDIVVSASVIARFSMN